jgi:hypothetical protein
MEFTVELRYQSGSSTVLSTQADTADQALDNVRDPRRPLIGIHITAPADKHLQAPEEPRGSATFSQRRVPVQHRPSRRRY